MGRIAVLHLPQRTVGGGVLAAPAARPDPQFWQRAGPGSLSALRAPCLEASALRVGRLAPRPATVVPRCLSRRGAAASCPEPSRLLFPGRGVAGTAQLGPFPTSSRTQPPASRFLPGRSRSVRPPPSSSASGAHVACGSPAGPRSAPRGHHPPDLQAPRPGPRVSSSSWLICWDAGRTRPFSAQGLLPPREPAGGREPRSPAGAEPRPSTASPLPAAPDALGLFLRGTGARAYEAAGSTPRGGARLGMPRLQPPLPGPLAVHTAGAESPGGRFRAQGLGCRHVTCGGVLGTGEGGCRECVGTRGGGDGGAGASASGQVGTAGGRGLRGGPRTQRSEPPGTLAAGGGPGSRGESRTVLRFSERWAGGARGCRLAGAPPGVPEWQQVPCELAAGVPPIPCSRPAWPRLRRVGRAHVLGWTLTRLAVCAPPSLRPAGKARRTSRSSAGGAALGVQPGPGCTRPCSWPRGQFPTEHWDLQSGEPQDQVKRGGLLMTLESEWPRRRCPAARGCQASLV